MMLMDIYNAAPVWGNKAPGHTASQAEHLLNWISSTVLKIMSPIIASSNLYVAQSFDFYLGLPSKIGLCNAFSTHTPPPTQNLVSLLKFILQFQGRGRPKVDSETIMNVIFLQPPKPKAHSSFFFSFWFLSDYFLTTTPHDLIEANFKTKLGGILI